jgi:hypothetical protein
VTEPSATTRPLLRGVVEDGDGRPVPGARLRFEGADETATTGADGSFGLPIPSGRAGSVLGVSDRGREYRIATAGEPAERARIVLVPPDGVPLRVLTPGSAPVPRRFGWQALRRTEQGLEAGPVGDATSPRFAVRGLRPGRYELVVWAGPFLPVLVGGVELDGSVSRPLLTLEVSRRGASVAGRVLTPRGEPRAGASVRLHLEGGGFTFPEGRIATRTDPGGRWRLEGLPAGRWTLLVDAGDGTPPTESVLTLLEREERSTDVVV